jgi:poly-beta-1,6-N-acetyl-D-glucosamine synthase
VETRLSYAVITPVRDELGNLPRLGDCLAAQTTPPVVWVIVDDGSTDGTFELATALAQKHGWVQVVSSAGAAVQRGAPVVRAFHIGVAELEPPPDVVVKLDADISLEPEHFELLLREFAQDPRLGIASGTCYEKRADGVWRQRHGTGPGVWGACRGYRRECLRDVLPLDERMGWDTLDLVRANVRGWRTRVLSELPFRHHRAEGERDGYRFRTARVQGEAAYYMGYRFSYLLVRTCYRALRNPAAIGLLSGFLGARIACQPRCPDEHVRAYIRRQQSLRQLPLRIAEALRPRTVLGRGTAGDPGVAP